MNTSTLKVALASFALAASTAAALVACSSDDSSNPQPAVHDSGTGSDSSMTTDGGRDTGNTMDTGVIDTGSCVSDAATCNSCYSPMQAQQDPYNACAPSTTSCIPFDNAMRVPANVPPVP